MLFANLLSYIATGFKNGINEANEPTQAKGAEIDLDELNVTRGRREEGKVEMCRENSLLQFLLYYSE